LLEKVRSVYLDSEFLFLEGMDGFARGCTMRGQMEHGPILGEPMGKKAGIACRWWPSFERTSMIEK